MGLDQLTKLPKAEPFLRWAGGKSWLLNSLHEYLPKEFNNYHEPFLGGGAVFFHIAPSTKCYLSDLNEEIINAYTQIRDNVNKVIKELKKHDNNEIHYYHVRQNKPKSKLQQAVRFIYLNRTSFN